MGIEKDKTEALIALVRKSFPTWNDFSDKRFIDEEIKYKQAAASFAQTEIGEGELRRLLEAKQFDDILERIKKVGQKANLMYIATPRTGDLGILHADNLDHPSFCDAFVDLLYGPGDSPPRLGRYLKYVADRGLPNKWTFSTYYLFLCHPDADIFVKPLTARWFIELVGGEKFSKRPNPEAYAAFKRLAHELKDALASRGAADMIDIQSFIWVAARAAEDREGVLTKAKREEFTRLFEEFAETYPATPAGQKHAALYREGRETGRRNFEEVKAARARGDDITELALTKLLPHTDSGSNREKGAWIYIAPTIQGDVKLWFEHKGWARAEDWPNIANAVYELVSTCVESPKELAAACADFDNLPFTKGMQTGFLTPILNAVRPEEFLLINNKSRKVINYFTQQRYPQTIRDYADVNAAGWKLLAAVKEVIGGAELPNFYDADILDMFDHWLWAEKRYWEKKGDTVNYWKIAPGENAWNWDACREGGFIAIGWDEFGDVGAMTREEFDTKCAELLARFPEWTGGGLGQVWSFAQGLKEGDRVVANKGTTEVLGIGTVTGKYYFVANTRHGHRVPVNWDDTNPRAVKEGGWRRTLIELDKEKFDTIVSKEDPPPPPGAFTGETFELLAGLHDNPNREYYGAHKDEFVEKVEGPFRSLLDNVAELLPPPVKDFMETEKNVVGRILKNDWGRGGAWDFYWGAFYPKDGKRTQDAQLFGVINRDHLEYGFYIGEYGSEQRDLFVRNSGQYREVLINLLGQDFGAEDPFFFGEHADIIFGPEDSGFPDRKIDWKSWLADPGGIGIHVSVFVGKNEVIRTPLIELSQRMARTFSVLFPLVLLAAKEMPISAIEEYLGVNPPPPPNPLYPIEKCAEDTCFQEALLERWVRAIRRKKQAIIYGPPGTSKTYIAEHLARHLVGGDDGVVELIQFHPAYAYEDFVQGLRPKANSTGGLDYPIVQGRFLRFCEVASSRTGICVLIIDEINRANLARVLGELMYLLEYRDRAIPLASGGTFKIPANVRIIGTMNTADRSIALVDHALRRRFAFLELYPDYDVLRRYHEGKKTGFDPEGLIGLLEQVNAVIDDRHYHVGITYFLRSDMDEHIEDVWRMEIAPYLHEYFFDDQEKASRFEWDKVKAVIINE